MYDYLIVGAGIFGSVFAYEANKKGKKCLVIDKRNHIGGNLYTEKVEGINVHKYGAHIFHTNNEEIWNYINQFSQFNNYVNSPIANYYGEIYNLPFNMNTFSRLWGIVTPDEAKKIIDTQKQDIKNPTNLEEQAISLVGIDIYNKLIKGYTEKQWGRECCKLPSFIIKRLPLRFTYNNNYFNDRYQGIPIGGYTQIIEKMLSGIEVRLNTNFFDDRILYSAIAKKIIFTGMIDEYYEHKLGVLEYRSLKFETNILSVDNYQGNAVVNYTDSETAYTRIIEHKHFEFVDSESTVISKEYPKEWRFGDEPYYPVNDEINMKLYNEYKKIAQKDSNVIFGGRLGQYEYCNMDKVILAALDITKKEFNE